jgi:hypothetical protein
MPNTTRVQSFQPKLTYLGNVFDFLNEDFLKDNMWYIPVENEKQYTVVSELIRKLTSKRAPIYSEGVIRLTNSFLTGRNKYAISSNLLTGGTPIRRSTETRVRLEIPFDENDEIIFNGRKEINDKQKEVLYEIHKLEKLINDSEEIIQKMLKKREDLIDFFKKINSKT